MGLEREVAGIEEAHLRAWNVAFERFRTRRQEERIVLAPDREERWLVFAEVGLKFRIHRDVGPVVAKQIELHFIGAGTDGDGVLVAIMDSGPGLSPASLERLFDPFYTTKPVGKGTGLGLSMVFGFARQSGGQVQIYSELGQGTMVCLYLPRHSLKMGLISP